MVVRPSPLVPNYDPDVFRDPTRFDIHRKAKRICHSVRAASLHRQHPRPNTITIAIRRLLARFPKAHLVDPGFTPVYGGGSANYGCKVCR